MIAARSFEQADVGVFGLARSGIATVRALKQGGANVFAWDDKEDARRAAEAEGATVVPFVDWPWTKMKTLVLSPGVPLTHPKPHDIVLRAKLHRVEVIGDMEIFAREIGADALVPGRSPVIAVTGTNGKTTTTAMAALLIERSGKTVAAAGNIGPTMLQTLADAIDAGAPETLRERLPEAWVLELSSFQLAASSRFDADAAALLNLSEDHLDWHGSMAAYGQAKAKVFGRHAIVVVNRDDAAAMRLVPAPETMPGRKGRAPRVVPRRVVSFGAQAPERPGDWGLVVENDMSWLARARDDDVSPRELTLQHLMPADALRVRGRHNALNALAALALATAIGCPLAPMLHALREYRGERHRVEFVAAVDGVDAFDDSKGTNVGATLAALEGLGVERAPAKLVVILGGDGKGQDFAPLGAALARHARAAVTIGRDAEVIERVVAAAGIAFERCATLEAAVDAAFARAERGDAVLLSPACASLDMFRNYAHRAEVFVAAVHAVAGRRGVLA